MKITFTSVQLIVMLAVPALVYSTMSTDSCVNKNPFLTKLRSSAILNVKIFDSVQTGSFKKCTEVWNKHGTCCELQSLINHARAESIIIHKKLTLLKQLLRQAFQKLSLFWNRITDPKSSFATAPLILQNLINQVKIDNPHLNLTNLEATINVLDRVDVTSCANALSKLRGGALCEICSGVSQHSFVANKALINTQICLDLYEQCKYQISAPVIFFGHISKVMTPIMEQIRKCFERSSADHAIESNPSIEALDVQRLAHLAEMEKMAKLINFDSHDLASKISFCEKLISIVDPPSFIRIENDIDTYIRNLVKALEVAGDSRVKNKNPAKEFDCSERTTGHGSHSVSERLLQNWESSEAILSGDLIVAPTANSSVDSSYSSYLGAVGTSNHGDGQDLMPINITQNFP